MKAFLRYYVELPYPAEKVDEVIGRLPAGWIDQAARDAYLRGLLMLGANLSQQEPDLGAGHVAVLLSPVQLDDHMIRRPLQWFAERLESCSPILRGDLELADLGPARMQLAISAQYQPFVHRADLEERMAAQRIGESTLKAFVDRIARYVETVLNTTASSSVGRSGQAAPLNVDQQLHARGRWVS